MRWEDWRKAKTSEAKTNSIVFDTAWKGRNSVLHYNFTQEFVPWKDLKKALHLIFSEGESKHMLSHLAAQRICETNKSSSKLENPRSTGVLSSENLGRKKYELRMWFWSANFEGSRVTYGSEHSGDLPLRDACLGKPRSINKRSFISSNIDSRCKGDNGKGMKGGHEEGTQKQKVRQVHFVALVDIRHIQKYEYIPENVRESNLKCGNYQALMKELYTNFQRRSVKQEWGQKIFKKLDNHQRNVWRLSSMKSCENEF